MIYGNNVCLKSYKRNILKLCNGETLDKKYKNHQLKGQWFPSFDCHILPDLVLIYQLTDTELKLVRLGSHSELF